MSFTNKYGYTLTDEVIEQIKNGTFPDIDEILAEALGIDLDEKDIMDFADLGVTNYTFNGFDEHAIYTATFEDNSTYTFPVPLFYFTND